MDKIKFITIGIKEVIGMDIEPEDKDVGIMDADFCLIFKDQNDVQLQIHFGTDEINKLIEVLQPQIDEIKSQEEMDRIMHEDHKHLEETNGR